MTSAAAAESESAPWVGEARGTIAFESDVHDAGCLIGSVPEHGAVTVGTGGFIMDGGCHALSGH